MLFIFVAALNCAAWQGMASHDKKLAYAVMPFAIVLQIVVVLIVKARGCKRAFWIGFFLAGFLAVCSLVVGYLFSSTIALQPDPVRGTSKIVVMKGYDIGDQMEKLWRSYFDALSSVFPNLPNHDLVGIAAVSGAYLATALAGGAVTWLIALGIEKSRRSHTDDIPKISS